MKFLLVLPLLVLAVSSQPLIDEFVEDKPGKIIQITIPYQWSPGADRRLPEEDIAKLKRLADIGDIVRFVHGDEKVTVTLVPGGWTPEDPIPDDVIEKLGIRFDGRNKGGISFGFKIWW